MIRIIGVPIDSSLISESFLVKAFMDEFKAVVSERCEFDSRDKYFLKAFPWKYIGGSGI